MEIEKQVKILKIVNIALVVLLIIAAYFVVLKATTLCHHTTITGKLIYLEDISRPENPKVGVYLKLILEYPKYVKFGEKIDCGFLVMANATTEVGIHLENTTGNKKDGFIVDVKDKNSNGVIDTGDIFHIYGRPLTGYKIMFEVNAIRGNLHIYIP